MYIRKVMLRWRRHVVVSRRSTDGHLSLAHVARRGRAECLSLPTIHDELTRFTHYLDAVCGLAAKTRGGRQWWVAVSSRESRDTVAHQL